MVWAIDALQSERGLTSISGIEVPSGVVAAQMGSEYFVPKWELESLITASLLFPKDEKDRIRSRQLRNRSFAAFVKLINYFKAASEAESLVYLDEKKILRVLSRAVHQQFLWQRGFFNKHVVYRYNFIYGDDRQKSFFKEKYGLSLDAMQSAAIGYYANFRLKFTSTRIVEEKILGVRSEDWSIATEILASSVSEMRQRASLLAGSARDALGAQLPLEYYPSPLRGKPIIFDDQNPSTLLCPLPELIVSRVTSGLFYDFIDAGGSIKNIAASRFELYCVDYLRRMMPALNVKGEIDYKKGAQTVKSPDILIYQGKKVAVVGECKARRINIFAQYADDPWEQNNSGFNEIAVGIFQIWRFVAHIRAGFVPDVVLEKKASGIVVTLDNWATMIEDIRSYVFDKAKSLADSDPLINDDDRIPVQIVAMDDLDGLLSRADEPGFLAALSAAQEPRYFGWPPQNIHRDKGYADQKKKFPFDLGEVAEWYRRIEEERRTTGSSSVDDD